MSHNISAHDHDAKTDLSVFAPDSFISDSSVSHSCVSASRSSMSNPSIPTSSAPDSPSRNLLYGYLPHTLYPRNIPSPQVKPRSVCVLGLSGAVGTLFSNYIVHYPQYFTAKSAVVGGSRLEKTAELCTKLNLDVVAIAHDDQTKANTLRNLLKKTNTNVVYGSTGVNEVVHREHDVVIGAINGIAALDPILACLPHTKILALANKEAIVCAGQFLINSINAHCVSLVPLDSEHSAIGHLLEACWHPWPRLVEKITLTASGGAVRNLSDDDMKNITREQLMRHPVWPNMGNKLMIDSATMINKILELIEAMWIFGVPSHALDVRYHPEGIIHGMLTFTDQMTHALLSTPDLTHAIARGLWWPYQQPPLPHNTTSTLNSLSNSVKTQSDAFSLLTLAPIDESRYPAISIARTLLDGSDAMRIAFNAANEVAVDAFLNGRISFHGIAPLVLDAVKKTHASDDACDNVEIVHLIDRQTRSLCARMIA